MSFKRSATAISPEKKSTATPIAESKSSTVAERKVVSPKSQQSNRPNTAMVAPKLPTLTAKQTTEAWNVAQTHRSSASVKMPDRNSSSRPDKTLSSIVKVKHKKDNGLPVAWRKELYGTRPGSAQARLDNLRAALQKEVEEQKKAKATSSIPIKRSVDVSSLPKEKIPSTPSQPSSASVTTVGSTSATPKVGSVKHSDTATEVPVVKRAKLAAIATVTEKLENSCEMDVDGVDTNSPEQVASTPPPVQTKNSVGRYSTPTRIPDRSSSSKLDKTLSSIVKVKNKKDNGLPVAWRKELYGTSPGSAQARLENLRAALQKEVEEQKQAKATSSVPPKRALEQKSPLKERATTPPSASQSRTPTVSAVAAISTVPEATVVKRTDAVPEVVEPTSTAPVAPVTEQFDDSCEMDVDETMHGSPEPADPFPPAIQASSKGMECGIFVKSKTEDQKADPDTKKSSELDTNDVSPNVVSDLKTKYKDGLSAFENYFYCVIDTNIFIENYNDFQGFLSKKYSGSQPIVVVPYKVLHELDTVKHKKPQLGPKITPVVKFLHQMLRAKDARVKGQHPWDDTIELMPVLSPDDSIINCALQVQSVAESGNVKVLLVSNDCNMLTKGLVANLYTCTMEELQTDFKF